jgi:regulator of protease activity HflC (stomatin/prohibitin superfamily)
MDKLTKTIIIVTTILVLFIGFSSCTVKVDSGEVGIVKHYGAIQSKPLIEGFHILRPWPFATVEIMNVQVSKAQAECLASSKDLQSAKTVIDVQYSIQAGLAPQILKHFGDKDVVQSVILEPAIQESVKSITSNFTAEQLVTKRDAVKLGIENNLKVFVGKTLQDKGISGAIIFANIAITDFQFSKEFNIAIEAKVKAEQDALRAENEKRTRITQAEAAKEELQLQADGASYKIEKESKARAEAIKREAEALSSNPSLIKLRMIEKWNGGLPTYTGESIPLLKMID